MELSGRVLPWLASLTAILFAAGLYLSFAAPPVYQQAYTVRIMFVHVPAAWVAMGGNRGAVVPTTDPVCDVAPSQTFSGSGRERARRPRLRGRCSRPAPPS